MTASRGRSCGAGPPRSRQQLVVPDPAVIVEILSPTTRRADVGQKLAHYFRVPTVRHHRILSVDRVQAIHRRRSSGQAETRALTEGDVILNPSGLVVPLAGFYPAGGADLMRG